jgi:predicted MFS family arabinose efflux permease
MLIHGIAPDEHIDRVVSLDSAISSLSRIVGPALGGLLLAGIGIAPVFFIAAVAYAPLAAVVSVLAVRASAHEPVRRGRLREATGFFRRLPILRWALITATLAETLALPLVAMMPAVTESLNRDAADRLGILVGCVAVGSVGQVLLLGKLRARHATWSVVGTAYIAVGALLVGIAFDDELVVAGFLLVAFGLAVSVGRTLLLTCVHVSSPDSHRHHVLSLYLFVTSAATPIGALIWGALADRVGIDGTLFGAGVVLMLGVSAGLIAFARHLNAPGGADAGLETELLPHDDPHALGHHVHGGVAVQHSPTALGRE